jgi:hypothetical protein
MMHGQQNIRTMHFSIATWEEVCHASVPCKVWIHLLSTAGVHLFTGYINVGFSHRWLVSLAIGTDTGEWTCQAVSCWESDARFERVKSYRTRRGGFCSPCIFPEKGLCLRWVCKILWLKSGKLGRRLQCKRKHIIWWILSESWPHHRLPQLSHTVQMSAWHQILFMNSNRETAINP